MDWLNNEPWHTLARLVLIACAIVLWPLALLAGAFLLAQGLFRRLMGRSR